MMRITSFLVLGLVLLLGDSHNISRDQSKVTVEELSKLLGMRTFTASVSLLPGEELYIGSFEEAGNERPFTSFDAKEKPVEVRIVLGYSKNDKSSEASVSYVHPSSSGIRTITIPQPYAGATGHTPAHKVGERFAFLKFEGADMYLGYWKTPNETLETNRR